MKFSKRWKEIVILSLVAVNVYVSQYHPSLSKVTQPLLESVKQILVISSQEREPSEQGASE